MDTNSTIENIANSTIEGDADYGDKAAELGGKALEFGEKAAAIG